MLLYTSLIYYQYIHYNLQYIRFNAFLTVIFVKKRFSMLNFSNTSFAIRVSSLHIFANIIASVAVAVINRYSQCAFNRRNDIYDYYIDSRGFTNYSYTGCQYRCQTLRKIKTMILKSYKVSFRFT